MGGGGEESEERTGGWVVGYETAPKGESVEVSGTVELVGGSREMSRGGTDVGGHDGGDAARRRRRRKARPSDSGRIC